MRDACEVLKSRTAVHNFRKSDEEPDGAHRYDLPTEEQSAANVAEARVLLHEALVPAAVCVALAHDPSCCGFDAVVDDSVGRVADREARILCPKPEIGVVAPQLEPLVEAANCIEDLYAKAEV